jgi:hypothetical protein
VKATELRLRARIVRAHLGFEVALHIRDSVERPAEQVIVDLVGDRARIFGIAWHA